MNHISKFNIALTDHCKRKIKLSNNATIVCRSKSTSNHREKQKQQSVANFYAGKSVFITGATGFLGKVFLEKLLYSCDDIDKVFILIRDKKGQSPSERLQQMLKISMFDRVKKSNPQKFTKIVPIVGDISKPNLGINKEDEKTLIDAVSVVFHSAATIKFFEPLHVAMNLNFESTRRLMNLSKRMKKLDNFVYISTAYTQTMYPVLKEKVYPAPAEIDEVYNFIEKYKSDKKKTKEFMGKRPNTYAFTKAMAENYVGTCLDLPVTIVRPSIVGASLNEPLPGWLDNWYGATGAAVDLARGLNHYCLGSPDNKLDLIPVDYVTNLALIAGARHSGGNVVPVFNAVTSGCNPVTWEKLFYTFMAEFRKHGLAENHRHFVYFKSKFMYDLATLLFQITPAYASDLLLRLKGEEPRYLSFLRRVISTRHSMQYFISNNWTFNADASRALFASLSEADQKEFPCDPAAIDWNSYLKVYSDGVRNHMLPQQLDKERAAIASKSVNKASQLTS